MAAWPLVFAGKQVIQQLYNLRDLPAARSKAPFIAPRPRLFRSYPAVQEPTRRSHRRRHKLGSGKVGKAAFRALRSIQGGSVDRCGGNRSDGFRVQRGGSLDRHAAPQQWLYVQRGRILKASKCPNQPGKTSNGRKNTLSTITQFFLGGGGKAQSKANAS